MKVSNADHIAHVEVRYAETDAMGIVHHSVYAVWFEQARTELLRTHGCPFHILEQEGYASPVLKIETEFLAPCHYGEIADIHITIAREDRLRCRFFYELSVNGKLCTRGSSLHMFKKNGIPCRKSPEKFLKAFFPEELETGK